MAGKTLTDLIAHLNAMQDGLNDTSKPLKEIGTNVERNILSRFATKIDPDGDKWKPWAESTMKRKSKNGNKSLLVDTRDMRRSVGFVVSGSSVKIGIGTDYSPIHEEGTTKIPRRAMLITKRKELSEKDQGQIMDVLINFIKGEV